MHAPKKSKHERSETRAKETTQRPVSVIYTTSLIHRMQITQTLPHNKIPEKYKKLKKANLQGIRETNFQTSTETVRVMVTDKGENN